MSDTHIDCCCGAKYMRKRDACPECGATESSKGIRLVLSDAAFRRLRVMRDLSGLTDSGLLLAPFVDRIIQDIDAGRDICSLKTRDERKREKD